MSNSPIPSDHLMACEKHQVVKQDINGNRVCPVCRTDAEADPGAVAGEQFDDLDLRWQMLHKKMMIATQLLIQDAEAQDIGPVAVAVADVGEETARNAAGYTVQERWFNVLVVQTGNNSRKIIKHQSDAEDAIQTIQDGDHYLEPAPDGRQFLDPDVWAGIPGYYAETVEYERPDDDTLIIRMDGFRSENAYKTARRELGVHADDMDLSIRTVEAGGRFSEGVVEVSA